MDKIKQWVKDIFSEDNGEAVCVAKVLAVLSVFAFIGYAIYGLIAKDHFALNEFASGLMNVLLGGGGVIAGKQFTQKSS